MDRSNLSDKTLAHLKSVHSVKSVLHHSLLLSCISICWPDWLDGGFTGAKCQHDSQETQLEHRHSLSNVITACVCVCVHHCVIAQVFLCLCVLV